MLVKSAVKSPGTVTIMVTDIGQAERIVVGSLIVASEATAAAVTSLRCEDFADPVCGRIFAAADRLREAGRAADEVTLSVALARGGDVRAAREVAQLVFEVPSPASAGYYAAHVLAGSVRRQLLAAGQRLASARPGPAEDLLELAAGERARIDGGLRRWRQARRSSPGTPVSLPAEPGMPVRRPNGPPRTGDDAERLVERVTVGTLLLAPERYGDVADWLSASDFADPLCAATYRVIGELAAASQPADPAAVLAALDRSDLCGGDAIALFRLIETVPVPACLDAYGRLVVEAELARTIRAAGLRVVQIGCRGGDPDELFPAVLAHTDPLTQLPGRWQRAHPPGPTRLAHLLPLTGARIPDAGRPQLSARAVAPIGRSFGR